MLQPLNAWTLRRKISTLTLLVCGTLLLTIGYTSVAFSEIGNRETRRHAAGLQRELLLDLVLEMARSSAGEDRREVIEGLTETFSSLVSALNSGGGVHLESGLCLDVPPPCDAEAALANRLLKDCWHQFTEHQKNNLDGLEARTSTLEEALRQVAPVTIQLKSLARRLHRVDEEEYEGHLELIAMAEAEISQSRSRIYKLDALGAGDELDQTVLALRIGLEQGLEQLRAVRNGSDDFDIDPLDDDAGIDILSAASAATLQFSAAVDRFIGQKLWQMGADEAFQAAVLDLEEAESSMAALEVEASRSLLEHTRMMQLALLSTAILAALMAAVVTLRGAIANLRRTGDLMSDIAEGDGDLTVRLDLMRSDEIGALGSAFDRFVDRVQSLVSDVASVVGRVGSSADSVEDVAEAVGQSTRTTVQTSEALNDTVTSLSDELQHVRQQVKEQSVGLAGSVNATLATANATKEDLDRLGERTREISSLVTVIEEIAFKTQLLSVNASVEAARAAENGHGFAVVAREVRDLATDTAEQTKEIERIINSVQKASSEARSGIERVTESVSAVSDQQSQTSAAIEAQLGGFGRHF
ncbi:MAG: methyl-accepting chemotaxis protein, partial [Planctomycetota bacterium]